jgi:hypothetical protein
MLADFLEKIRELAKRGDSVQIATHDGLPDSVFVRHGDSLEVKDVPPSRRTHTVQGYEDITKAVNDPMCSDGEIFHDHAGISLHLNRGDRRDTIRLPLNHSERWAKLESMRGGGKGTVRDVIRTLRFDLHGTGIESVIQALSKIDFTRKSDGGASVSHGRESLGQSVEASVQQADSVPETFVVHCSVYTNPGFRELTAVEVTCGIYLDLQNEQIEIRVLADELSKAENAAQTAIGAKLAVDLPGTPVFHGCP